MDINVQTDMIDLSEVIPDFCDGRSIDKYSEKTGEVLTIIQKADGYIFGTPMYGGLYN